MLTRFILVCSLALPGTAPAQNAQEGIKRVYVGTDGLAHVVDPAGHDKAIAKQTGELEVGDPKLSLDRRFAGWTINGENCCTSYPIPVTVAIYLAGNLKKLRAEQSVYDWCFVPGRAQVAIASGPVHGVGDDPRLALFDAASGKTVLSYKSYRKRPSWAQCLDL